MRRARKSSLYRNEVTEAAVSAVRAALARVAAGAGPLPQAVGHGRTAGSRCCARRSARSTGLRDDTATVLRKIHSADGFPGVRDQLCGRRFQTVRCAGRAASCRHARYA